MHGCNSKIRALAALFFVGIFAFYPALLRAEETKEYFFARAALDDLLPLVWTIGDMTGAPFERPLERRTPLASSPVAAENSSAAGHASLPGKDMAAKMRTLAVVALAEFRDTAESFVERLKEEARPYRVPDQLPPPSPPPRTPGAFSFPAREKAVETLEQSISSLKKFFDENVFVNAQMPVREIMRGAPRPPSDDMSAAAAFASALAAAADDTIRSLDALEESLSFAKDVVGERVSDFSKHAMASEEKLRAVFSLLDRFVKTIERERISSAPSFTPAPASLKTFSFAEGFDERLASLATLVDTARSRLEAALPEIEVPVIEAFEAEGNAALSLAPLKDSFTSLKNRFAPAATGTERVSRENRESVTAPSPVLPRIIERIIERPAGEIPVVAGNVSAETLTARLSELENELRAEIFRMAAQNASSQAFTLPILQAVSLAQRINKLSDVTISDATITGSSFAGSVSGTSGSFESATVSGSASTSALTVSNGFFQGGFEDCAGSSNTVTYTLATGKFGCDPDGGGGSGSPGGSTGQVQFNNGGNFEGNSSLFVNIASGRVGVSTSTPYAAFSVATSTRPQLLLSDSSAAADLKHWYASSTGGSLVFGTLSDSLATLTPRLTISTGGLTTIPGGLVVNSASSTITNLVATNATTTNATTTYLAVTSVASTSALVISGQAAASGNNCLQVSAAGVVTKTGSACGAGGGGSEVNWTYVANAGDATFGRIYMSTTTNQAIFGDTATSSLAKLEVIGNQYISGNVGIGTTSPYAKLSVAGEVVGAFFTATTTSDSTFPNVIITNSTTTNATTTNLAVSNIASTTNLVLSSAGTGATKCLQVSATGLVSAAAGECGTSGGITSIGPAGQTEDGPTVTFATSSTAYQGLTASTTITGNGADVITFANTLSGILAAGGGGTGISNPTAAGILLGTYAGGAWQQLATSSLNIDLANTAGTLAISRGGTNSTAQTVNGVSFFNGTSMTSGTDFIFDGTKAGIGSTSPSALLAVHANNGATNKLLLAIASSTASATTTLFSVDNTGLTTVGDSSGTGDATFQFASDVDAWSMGYFSTDKTFRIASSTNLSANVLFQIGKSGTTTLSAGLGTGTGGNYLCIDTTTFEILRGGGFACTASSLRFKENIKELAYGIDDVMKLHPVTFMYKPEMNSGTSTHLGFIAEEVELVVPELVSYNSTGQVQGLDYPVVTALLTKALQEVNQNLESIASTTASSTPASESFATRFFDNVFAQVRTWLADAANGVGDLFANRLRTKELCVRDESGAETCISKTTLDSLLSGQAASAAGSPPSAETGSTAADTEAPIVTLNGNNPATTNVGDVYGDLGATVTDNVDDNLGYKVSLNGGPGIDVSELSLDTSVAGTHEIFFSATDQAGNTGTTTRTVNVVDPAAATSTTPME